MRVIKYIFNNLERILTVLVMCAILVVCTVDVFTRFVLRNPVVWGDEAGKFLFMALIYFTAAYASQKEQHIVIDAFDHVWPKKMRPYVQLVGRILFIILCLIMTVEGTRYAITIFQSKSTAVSLPWLNIGLMYGLIPFCFLMIGVHMIFRLKYWRTKFLNPEETGASGEDDPLDQVPENGGKTEENGL